MEGLTPEALQHVATYFQALAEPMRLRLLNELRTGERNVGELAEAAGTSMANVSRHLSFLTQRGMVERETRGTAAYYRIADPAVYKLCDIVCGSIARVHERQALGAAAFARAGRRRSK
ncbi:ArsR/SmtB family transcription factor [Ramlibacter albus]|uniref:Winged helix-turn-helix transcriptional regulator n=1 Tax=Ramlibacter albus TaxID=2079448 RepID=A0A923M4B7_9BURK|nr:metalloregulator ArsR/SmtB family transcription factor [Ramlibacter albus]MBC5763947.1 winged helix-turn-helix transcriptional regulator [Ramlibacter albus]